MNILRKKTHILCISLLLSCTNLYSSEVKHVGYKLIQGHPENSVAVFIDKDSNCIQYTEFLGDHFGVSIRCLMANGIISNDLIRLKVIDLISKFTPIKYQHKLINEFSNKFDNKLKNEKWRADIAGDYLECFLEIVYTSESVVLTIKCVR